MHPAPSRTHDTRADDTQRLLQSAVSLARVGLYGKACRVLQSSGIAPDNNNTWHLLQAKHPSCPLPTVSDIPTNSLLISPDDFDILSMLTSFPKGTAAGPSGLRVQNLLDAASIPLQTSICSSLRDIVNLLASGKAPSSVSKFLTGGSVTALSNRRKGALLISVQLLWERLDGSLESVCVLW